MTRSVGIVAEYNPFHNGHKYLLEKAREVADTEGTVISVMSGDFVQRGEPAMLNKHARAEAACRSGVNIVAELPLPWSLMSAEGFAAGGVGILDALGVNTLAFGAESDNITELESLSRILLDSETDVAIARILSEKPEKSYAAARLDAVNALCGKGELLSSPNNILAVEYIKAVLKNSLDMNLFSVERTGAGHDSMTGSDAIRSASFVRDSISSGDICDDYVTEESLEVLNREIRSGRAPVTMKSLEQALMSRLRMLSSEDYERLPDSRGGAGMRLYSAVKSCGDLGDVLSFATTNRYPTSRMRRMIMFAALGIDSELCAGSPPYIRILAADARGREYLRKNAEIIKKPLVTKPASVKTLGEECLRVFETGASARDLYVLGYSPEADRKPGSDYRTSPFML